MSITSVLSSSSTSNSSARRHTLGPINFSTLSNIKDSMSLPTTLVKEKEAPLPPPRRSLERRQSARFSLGATASSTSTSNPSGRRSSTGISSKSTTTRSDPRPTTDKAWLKESIKKLVVFLADRNYKRTLTHKSLLGPSRKDFICIMEFLFTQIDPNFTFAAAIGGTAKGEEKAEGAATASSAMSLEEEVVKKYMKGFGYPFAISKPSLSAPGSLHTWPTVLAMIIWLVEFIQYDEKASTISNGEKIAPTEATSTVVNNNEKAFFDYTAASYANFLAGNDSNDELDGELAKSFQQKNVALLEEINSLKLAKEKLSAEDHNLMNKLTAFVDLKKKKENLLIDKEKFIRLIDDLGKHRQLVEQKYNEKMGQYEEQKQQLFHTQQEKESLVKALEKQEFTPIQVQSMHQQKILMEDTIASLQKQKERVVQEMMTIQRNINKTVEDIEKKIEKCNSIIGKHNGEIAKMMKRSNLTSSSSSSSSSLSLSDDGDDTTSFAFLRLDSKPIQTQPLSVQFFITPSPVHVLVPELQRVGSVMESSIRGIQENIQLLHDKAITIAESNSERSEKILQSQTRQKKIDDTYRQEKEMMQKELSAAVCRVEDEELYCHKLRASSTLELENSQAQLNCIEKEVAELKKRNEEERKNINGEMMVSLEMLMSHKEKVMERVKQLKQQAEMIKQQIDVEKVD